MKLPRRGAFPKPHFGNEFKGESPDFESLFDFADTGLKIVQKLMLPESDHFPAQRPKLAEISEITSAVGPQFVAPKRG